MNRWKCPDCGGWVLNTVLVHFCTKPEGGTTRPPAPYFPRNPYYPTSGGTAPSPTSPYMGSGGSTQYLPQAAS